MHFITSAGVTVTSPGGWCFYYPVSTVTTTAMETITTAVEKLCLGQVEVKVTENLTRQMMECRLGEVPLILGDTHMMLLATSSMSSLGEKVYRIQPKT